MNYIKAPSSTSESGQHIDSEDHLENSLEVQKDQFKLHQGKNYFFYFKDGYPQITIGPHWPLSLCLLICILIATYFISFVMTMQKNWFWKLSSVACGLHLAISFVKVALKNPGINIALVQTEYQKGYCKSCLTLMVAGTVHCPDCDICVRGHDHHCPWTGKCIGEGNMFEFQWFLCAFLLFFIFSIAVVVF